MIYFCFKGVMCLKLGNIITYYHPHKRHNDGFYMIPNTKKKVRKSNVMKKLIL